MAQLVGEDDQQPRRLFLSHAEDHDGSTICRSMGEVLAIQIVEVLMRHATISLTADLYGNLGIDDLGEKVWALPGLGIAETEDSPSVVPPAPRPGAARGARAKSANHASP